MAQAFSRSLTRQLWPATPTSRARGLAAWLVAGRGVALGGERARAGQVVFWTFLEALGMYH